MFQLPDLTRDLDRLAGADEAAVQQVLTKSQPDLADLPLLLSSAAGRQLGVLAAKAAEITAQRFGRVVQLYAPLYLSNFCTNACDYCGFSASNRIRRRKLTLAEAEAEAEILRERGFQHLLLVSGEAEQVLGVELLAALAIRLRDKFAALSIEVQPLSQAGYAQLFEAGITGVAIYQETYDPVVYAAVHLAGKKQDYAYRLATPARAAAAGMREVGIGALLGLADWRQEGLALGHHLHWLRTHYWKTGFTVSFPRLRPAAGTFSPLYPAGEAALSQLIFALRITDPDVGLVLSTREEVRFRDGMLGLGPTRYSAGSCTAPGGYSEKEASGEQFSIGDQRSLEAVCQAITRKGLDPVWKDWDAAFQIE